MSAARLRAVALAVVLIVVAAGCGREAVVDPPADPAPGTTPPPPPPASEPGGGATPARQPDEATPATAAAATGPRRVGGEVVPPRKISGADLDLRAIAECGAPQPSVPIIATVIGVDGRVESAEVRNETGNSCVDRLLVDTFSGWRFEPATLDGRPVRVEHFLTVTIHYR